MDQVIYQFHLKCSGEDLTSYSRLIITNFLFDTKLLPTSVSTFLAASVSMMSQFHTLLKIALKQTRLFTFLDLSCLSVPNEAVGSIKAGK